MKRIIHDEIEISSIDEYSYEETLTNKIWKGKRVYRRCYDYTFNSFVGLHTFLHNIQNLDGFVNIWGMWHNGNWHNLPFTHTSDPDNIALYADRTQAIIIVGVNRNGSVAFIVLEYTKTIE